MKNKIGSTEGCNKYNLVLSELVNFSASEAWTRRPKVTPLFYRTALFGVV